jgi:radical SAM superfamily enzyme YgiQ (UPF0313 family)
LLVNPAFDGRAEAPPLGLLCLAAVLIEDGSSARVLDLDVPGTGEPHDRLREEIGIFGPSVLGVTSTSRNYDSALQAVRQARKIAPGIITVLGGVHATAAYRGILESAAEVDFLIRGEGEFPFRELLRRLAEKRGFDSVESLSYRADGGIVHNPRGRPADLEGLPLPAHELARSGDYRARSISSSRGCFHGCSFCSIREMHGSGVRFRPAGPVIEELHSLTVLGGRRIMFTDDNFTADPGRLRDICGRMIKTGLAGRAEYIAEGRLDDIACNPLSSQFLGEAGFRYIYTGAESGSQRILDYYGKKTTPDAIFEGAMHCLGNNVMPVVNFIVLGPRDNVRTIRETIAFARRLFEAGAEIAYTETLVPYPGTALRGRLEKEGRLREKDNIYWFETEDKPGYEEFLCMFAGAREEAQRDYGHRPLFDRQRVYFELGCLDRALSEYAGCRHERQKSR